MPFPLTFRLCFKGGLHAEHRAVLNENTIICSVLTVLASCSLAVLHLASLDHDAFLLTFWGFLTQRPDVSKLDLIHCVLKRKSLVFLQKVLDCQKLIVNIRRERS